MIIVLSPNESELNSMDNKKVEATMDRHSTPRRKQKRKETIAKWKISLFDKRWDWSISVDSLK